MYYTKLAGAIIIGVALFFQDLIRKACWSLMLYLARGEFNHDGCEETVDKFDHHNPNTGSIRRCYIFKYGLFKVKWGFYIEGEGMVIKNQLWTEWASWSKERFPLPIQFDNDDIDEIANSITKTIQ